MYLALLMKEFQSDKRKSLVNTTCVWHSGLTYSLFCVHNISLNFLYYFSVSVSSKRQLCSSVSTILDLHDPKNSQYI